MTDTSDAVAAYLNRARAPAQAAQASVNTALGSNPDYEAELQKVAHRTGVPVDTARAYPDDLKKQAQASDTDFSALAERFPRTAGFLSGHEDAKIAHDDIENLGLFETAANSFRRGVPALQSMLPAIQAANQATGLQHYQAIDDRIAAGENPKTVLEDYKDFGLAPLPWATPEQALATWGAIKAQTAQHIADSLAQSVEDVAQHQQDRAAIPTPDVVTQTMAAKTWGEALSAISQAPLHLTAAIGPESLMQSAPGLLAAVPAGLAAGPAGAAAALGTGSYISDYASSLTDVLQSNGVDTADAAAIKAAFKDPQMLAKVTDQAMKHAQIVGAFDAVSGGLAGKTLLPKMVAARLAARPLAKELANMGVHMPLQAALGAAGEAGGELNAGQQLQPGQVLAEAFGEFFGAPGEVIAASGKRYHEHLKAAKQAEDTATTLTQLSELAKVSKVLARDASTFERFAEQVTKDGPLPDVYISAQALMQSGVAEQVAEASPSVAGQLTAALATGTDIRIPTSEYVARIAGTELNQSLIEHLKADPNDVSLAEAKQLEDAGAYDDLKADIERTLTEVEGKDAFKQSVDEVRDYVQQQLDTANNLPKSVNATYAALWAARFATLGAQLGRAPMDVFREHALTVQSEPLDGEQVFKQTAFHGTPHRGIDKFATDAVGTGEGNQAFGWGLYFTNSRSIAEHYRGELTYRNIVRRFTDALPDHADTGEATDWADSGEAPADMRNVIHALAADDWLGFDYPAQALTALFKEPEQYDISPELRKAADAVKGQVYEVEIPEDEEMLRWDARLNEQPTAVRDALKDAGLSRDLKSNKENFASPMATRGELRGENIYAYLEWKLGSAKAASARLLEIGVKGINYPAGTIAGNTNTRARNYVVFTGNDVAIKNQFYQGTGNRGAFDPATNVITLLKNADLSTFLHESGHFFLETQFKIAADLQRQANIFGTNALQPGEQQVLQDTQTLLNWFGTPTMDEWYNLDFEEMRHHHEKFARGFEAYLFEGKAPNIELQGVFQRFRAFIISAYRQILKLGADKVLDVKLTDQVRGVMDRMIATTDEIKLAEQGRWMFPLFDTADKAGMEKNDFAEYQRTGVDASNEAIQDLQSRGLRDMQWIHNARGREIKKLKKKADAVRREAKIEVRREVMSQPVYRAWQFLTAKMDKTAKEAVKPVEPVKSKKGKVDPKVDSLFVAIAKLGGIDRKAATSEWGIDANEKNKQPIFGKYLFTKKGLTPGEMEEALGELGYLPPDEHGKSKVHALQEKFTSELRGDLQYSAQVSDAVFEPEHRPGAGVSEDNVGAGRLHAFSLDNLGLPSEITDHIKNLGMTADNGIHPDLVADIFGFTSGDDLIRTLAAAEDPKVLIENLTDAKMLEAHGELSSPDAIARSADVAIHNNARARMVATEANVLAKATGKPKILKAAAQALAFATVARQKVKDVKPHLYAAAETRAAKEAMRAERRGDLPLAAAQKRNQLFATYATKEAYTAQDDVERGLAYLKKASKPGSLPAAYYDSIVGLLEKFDLRASDGKRRADFSTWVKSQLSIGEIPPSFDKLLTPAARARLTEKLQAKDTDGNFLYTDEGEQAEVIAQFLDAAPIRNYQDISVEEFRGLVEAVKQITHVGRRIKRALTDERGREFDAIVEEIERNAVNVATRTKRASKDVRTSNTQLGKTAELQKGWFASHLKAAAIVEVIDGTQGGPLWEAMTRTANKAGDAETLDLSKTHDKVVALLRGLQKEGSITDSAKSFPSIGRSLNRQARLVMALNLGNESNEQRLLGGEGWTRERIAPVLATLTKADWDFVQSFWDLYEELRPAWEKVHRDINGFTPELVIPRAFTVTTADGHTVSLRGGYVPVIFDPRASGKAQSFADEKSAKQALQAARVTNTVNKSFTKARVDEVKGRPLMLSLDALINGMQDTIHYVHWQPWIIDANRYVKALDATIRTHYGAEIVTELRSWVSETAAGVQAPRDTAERWIAWTTKNISFATLALNVMNAAQQVTGITSSMVTLGEGQPIGAGTVWLARGVSYVLKNRTAAYREAVDKSAFMRKRATTMLRDLNEAANVVQDQGRVADFKDKYGYILTQVMQVAVDLPTWWGAYHKALALQNGAAVDSAGAFDDSRAVALADQTVIDSQGGGSKKDLARYERATGAMRLLTGFMAYMNTMFNQNYRVLRSERSVAKKAVDLLLINTVPVVLMVAMKAALTPGDSGLDDPEEVAKKIATEQLGFLFGQMVGLREISQLFAALQGERFAGNYGGPVGTRTAADILRLAQQAGQGDTDLVLTKAVVSVAGDIFRLPSTQINRTLTGVEALQDGKTENPTALVFGFQTKH